MPGKCSCAGSSCSCLIQAGSGVTVTGVGSTDRPYVISSAPTAGAVTVNPSETTYSVGQTGPLGALNAYAIEFDPGVSSFTVHLPDGSTAVAAPDPGAQFDLYIIGSDTATIGVTTAGSGVITWVGDTPVGDQQGWYHFVYLPTSTGPRYLGTYVG